MINWFNTYAPFCKMPEQEPAYKSEEAFTPYWLGLTQDGRLSLRLSGSSITLHMTKSGCQTLIDSLNTFIKQLPEDSETENE